MTALLVVWNSVLTAGVLYVIAGYLWHINVVHRPGGRRPCP